MNPELERQKGLVNRYLVSQGSLIPIPAKGKAIARECKKYRLGKGKVTNATWHARIATAYKHLVDAGAIENNELTSKAAPPRETPKRTAGTGRYSRNRNDQKIARLTAIGELRRRGYKVSNAAGYMGLARLFSTAVGVPLRGAVSKRNARQVLVDLTKSLSGSLEKTSFNRFVREPHPFYDSRDWQELRYKALKKYGRKCSCCGKTQADGAVLHVDHIKPRSKYPELALDINNLQILCEDCNLGKGAWDDTDFRPTSEKNDRGEK